MEDRHLMKRVKYRYRPRPKIADGEFHGERGVAISRSYKEITTHSSGARNDIGRMTLSFLSAILGQDITMALVLDL